MASEFINPPTPSAPAKDDARLVYAVADRQDYNKRRLSLFVTLVLTFTLLYEFGLLLGGAWAIKTGVAHHIGWITRLKPWHLEVIGWTAAIVQLLIALRIIIKLRRKLIGVDVIAAEKAEEKRRLKEEIAAIGWHIPRSAEAADWRKFLLIIVFFYIGTFLAVLVIASASRLIDSLGRPSSSNPQNITPLHGALICGNLIGLMMMGIWLLLVFVLPRQRIRLVSDGVLTRHNGTLIPYSLIQKVRIIPSPRCPTLQCFAILATDQYGDRWRHYEFSADAPIPQIIAAFQTRGVGVESPDGSSTWN